ncbi:MAG: hypothetical protein LCH68_16340 [Proteobacteria bacterium]|nr:hypothetical protein [Pseudomonadota bacterium]
MASEDEPVWLRRAKAEPARVEVSGDTLYYTGNLSAASTKVFDAAVAGVEPGQLTRLVVSSGGGDTIEGRHVGRWVQRMGLVVEVDAICFSSCADYLFPAGRARVIRADAWVGWHGNERQFDVLAARHGVPLADELRRFVPPNTPKPQADAFVRDLVARIAETRQDEADFYARLGMDDAFAVCAVGDELEQRFGFTGRKGWGFSVEDMVQLGLANTVYLGSGRYEKDSAGFKRYLAQISAGDCRQLLQTPTPSPEHGTPTR